MTEPSPSGTSADPVLVARGLTLGYGSRIVLEKLDLEVPARAVVGIMGPSGAGKTTLLRALSGRTNPSPAYWARGSIRCAGRELLADTPGAVPRGGCPLLAQKDRLYAGSVLDNLLTAAGKDRVDPARPDGNAARSLLEPVGLWETMKDQLQTAVLSLPLAVHKKLLIARMLSMPTKCLFVDEPLSDIAIADEDGLIDFLRALGRDRAVVVVLHNKLQARRLCDLICLLSGGRLIETTPADDFFAGPKTEGGREFLERGSSWVSAARHGDEADETPMPAVGQWPAGALPWATAPVLREFRWVIEGRLGGAQRPGLLGNEDEDLRALRQLGVRHLVSLTEDAYDPARLAAFGIRSTHFPVPDMGVPALAPTVGLCRQIAEGIERGEPTVFHCRAGLGRTGTLLACLLVQRGLDAGSAIRSVRQANPRYIQTEAQLQFVADFEACIGVSVQERAATRAA